MSASNKNQIKKTTDQLEQEADVLYQRIGNQWYTYCVLNDEVFMAKVPSDLVPTDKLDSNKTSHEN